MMSCCVDSINLANFRNVNDGEEEEDEDAREGGTVVEDEPAWGLRSRWVPLSAEEEWGEGGAGEARKA
jgi:hypothetical protein